MKKLIFTFLIGCLFMLFAAGASFAGTATIIWKLHSSPGPWRNDPIINCGGPTRVDFYITYTHSGSCKNLSGLDIYKVEISLWNPDVSGNNIDHYAHEQPSCNSAVLFEDIPVYPNRYHATAGLFKKKAFGFNSIDNVATSYIDVSNTPAVPNFTIRQNGTPYPPTSPITVHIKDTIYLDAAATTCETVYWVGVAERGYPSWTRTYDYEWGRWFQGQAPDGLNLQLLAVTYSVPPYYLNGNSDRHGTPLFGEPLPSGEERWYDVAVCTAEPQPSICKNAQLRVEDP